MATVRMQRVRPGEVPRDGGTAIQEDAGRPVFNGNGPNDYICAECGNLLARSMGPEYMTFRVRVRCGGCRTVNVAVNDDRPNRRSAAPR
jgi:phage FluMu protein Com